MFAILKETNRDLQRNGNMEIREKCGFIRSHSIKNFFLDHYNHPIYEAGMQLVDMIILRKKL